MTTILAERWPIWTDGGTGSPLITARPAAWVYRLKDGTYLTVSPDAGGGVHEIQSVLRPCSPDGLPIVPQWNRLVVRLPPGPATDALIAELEAAGECPDRDLLCRLVAGLTTEPAAEWLLIASDVRIECNRGGWVGRKTKARGVEVRVTYYL